MKRKNNDTKKEHSEIPESNTEFDIELEETEFEEVSMNDKLKKLRQELTQAKQQSQEYLTGWQKERASFANYKNEEEKKRHERLSTMKINLLTDIIPVLDSFDMAFKNKEAWEKVDASWRSGVEYIYTQLMNILGNYSIKTIEALDVDFDPMIHEPIEEVTVNKKEQDNKVIELVQKGYQSGDSIILRPAKVKVGKYDHTGDTD